MDMRLYKQIWVAFILLPSIIILHNGCTTVSVQKIPPQEGIYPAETEPDTPLVLAIPGLVVPGLPVTQQQHFGYLVEMLAAEGIPCRVLTYNTREDPLVMDAALFSPELSIAWTRVGPAIVSELELENERRAGLGLPPVKKLVLFGYSQGGVIVGQIARSIFFKFRSDYKTFTNKFGDEWKALQNDPEFLSFINSLDDFLVIRNIKFQYEGLFKRSPALRRFYDRAEKKAEKHFEALVQYLVDPSQKYPSVEKFEPPESPYYPKRYRKVREYAETRATRSEEEKERNIHFFTNYAQYRSLLTVEPYFITASASLFGSPQANDTLRLVRLFPFLKLFLGREYYQIKQTELGTVQHRERIENLVRLEGKDHYPVAVSQVLFIVGANGAKGDGFVDQPAAHTSRHAFNMLKVVQESGKEPRLEPVKTARLPDLAVVPLEVMHFPEKALWGLGGSSYGSAYMVEGNPSFPYLLNFIRGDWQSIEKGLEESDDILRQFMIEISFIDAKMNRFSARRKGQSDNIKINGRYYNRTSGTIVWTGYFKESGILAELKQRAEHLNPLEIIPGVSHLFSHEGEPQNLDFIAELKEHAKLLNPAPLLPEADDVLGWTGLIDEVELAEEEEGDGEVRFRIRLPSGKKVPLSCRVYPGCINFVRIETGKGDSKQSGSRAPQIQTYQAGDKNRQKDLTQHSLEGS